MNDAAAVRAAIEAGVDCCGENRVQEIQEKRPQGAYEGKPLHFIGHLQTNKVKYIVGVVDLIESVDRLELLQCIEKQAAKVCYEIGNRHAPLFWGENDTFITIYNEPMLLMLQKLHGVTAEKELKKLDFDQRISASIHNHHH